MTDGYGRCRGRLRHRLPLSLVLGLVVVAACGPARPSASVAESPATTATPIPSPTAAPDPQLVVLLRGETGSRLVTFDDGLATALPLPAADAHGLAIDRQGRVAVVAARQVWVAEGLPVDDASWTPAPEFGAALAEFVTGLAWSPGGILAAATTDAAGAWPFDVVVGPVGQSPTRTAVEAGLDGVPVWLDEDHVAVPAVRDPQAILAVVAVGTGTVEFRPIEVADLAVNLGAGLVALVDRRAPRVELRPLAELGGRGDAVAVLEGPAGSAAGAVAFSPDGDQLAVAWLDEAGVTAISLYEGSRAWREGTRLEVTPLNLGRPVTSLELAWRP